MLLAFDTSSAACTAALFDEAGKCVASADEQIGRGHSERLVPMLEELLAGRRANSIIVGIGPGSFTGIRVGVAAAQGLAIGWDAELKGMSSLALLAADAERSSPIAAAVIGGHGEIFVQEFENGEPLGDLLNATPADAARQVSAPVVLGSGAAQLVAARGSGKALDAWPSARHALSLPPALRSLDASPLYARAPDAKPQQAA